MIFLVFVAGIIVGALIVGSVFMYKDGLAKETDKASIKAMKDYIQELEHKNDELTEMYNRQREAFIRLS